MIACHRVVRRHTCSRVTRRSTRVTEARGASGVHVGQPAPKIALKASHKVFPRPEECLGWTSARRMQPEVWRLRHELSWLEGVCSHRFVFIILAKHFRARTDLPKESSTWDLAKLTRRGRTCVCSMSKFRGEKQKKRMGVLLCAFCPHWRCIQVQEASSRHPPCLTTTHTKGPRRR